VDIEFRIIPTIRVEINHAEDPTKYTKSGPALSFMRWCIENEVYGFRGCSTGPTGLVQYFEVENTEKIRAYMLEQGFVEGDV